jgi:hypothetical protein
MEKGEILVIGPGPVPEAILLHLSGAMNLMPGQINIGTPGESRETEKLDNGDDVLEVIRFCINHSREIVKDIDILMSVKTHNNMVMSLRDQRRPKLRIKGDSQVVGMQRQQRWLARTRSFR